MKVLQINSVCGVGSTGRIATDIHNILLKQRHESYIGYGRDIPKDCNTAIRIGNRYDNYVHVALTRAFDKHGFGSKKATLEFIDKIDELKPDVIHLHNIHGYYINVEILFNYIKKVNKPVIWTLHDCWAFTGHCVHFEYINCNKWQTGCAKCPQIAEYPTSLLLDKSRVNYFKKKELFTSVENMYIVTPSEWLAKLVGKSFLGKYPSKVINNGIDLSVFKPTHSEFRRKYNIETKFIILGVARWDKRKGLEYFIELSKQLDNSYQIVIVGLTEEKQKALPMNIIGITKTNNTSELVDIYSAADVFVNPTFEDNFPTTNLEALACGTPVITFNTGGSVESIDENCGFIIEKGDLRGLVEAISKIREKDKLEISNRCVRRVAELYNKKDRYYEYLQLYKEILNWQDKKNEY